MAIVPNLALGGAPNPGGTSNVDRPYCSHNRVNAGEPNGSLIPQYAGEIVLDTTNDAYWKAMALTNNSWVTLTTPF